MRSLIVVLCLGLLMAGCEPKPVTVPDYWQKYIDDHEAWTLPDYPPTDGWATDSSLPCKGPDRIWHVDGYMHTQIGCKDYRPDAELYGRWMAVPWDDFEPEYKLLRHKGGYTWYRCRVIGTIGNSGPPS